jgi:hypothetical protein
MGSLLKVLYLDFDGVLHHEDVWFMHGCAPWFGTPGAWRMFEHAHLLVKALEPYPDVKIVLSTTWVKKRGFGRSRKRLPDALRPRVIGATYHSQMAYGMSMYWNPGYSCPWMQMTRGAQVHSDIGRRRPDAWVAVDDCHDGWRDLSHVVLTNEVLGISDPAVYSDLEAKLEAHFGERD